MTWERCAEDIEVPTEAVEIAAFIQLVRFLSQLFERLFYFLIIAAGASVVLLDAAGVVTVVAASAFAFAALAEGENGTMDIVPMIPANAMVLNTL